MRHGVSLRVVWRAARAFGELCRSHWQIVVVVLLLGGGELFCQRVEVFLQKYYTDVPSGAVYAVNAVRGVPRYVQDEQTYVPVARRTLDGLLDGTDGDAHVYEHRRSPTPFPPIPNLQLGLLMWLAGGPDGGLLLHRFLAVMLIPLLAYVAMFVGTGDRLIAVVGAVLVPFLSRIAALYILPVGALELPIMPFLHVVGAASHAVDENVTRVLYQGLSYPWLFAFLAALAWMLTQPSRRAAVICGVLMGLQSLVYPYYMTAIVLGLPLFFVWLLVRRETEAARSLVLAGVVGAIVALPSVIHQYSFRQLPQYDDVMFQFSRYSHVADPASLKFIVAAVPLWLAGLLLPRGPQRFLHACLAIVVGAALSMNLQIVTGVELQNWHWEHRVILPLMTLALVVAGGSLGKRAAAKWDGRVPWRAVAAVAAAVLVTFATTKIVAARVISARKLAPYHYIPADHHAAYEWLRRNASDEDVVLSLSTDQINLLPVYAETYTYLPLMRASITPFEEVKDRWTAACRFYGMPEPTFEDLISGEGTERLYNLMPPELSAEKPPWWFERVTIHEVLFHKRFRKIGGSSPYVLPDSVKADLRRRFRRVLDPDAALRDYRVDYVWQGPYERAVGTDSLGNARSLELVFERGRVRLYRVK